MHGCSWTLPDHECAWFQMNSLDLGNPNVIFLLESIAVSREFLADQLFCWLRKSHVDKSTCLEKESSSGSILGMLVLQVLGHFEKHRKPAQFLGKHPPWSWTRWLKKENLWTPKSTQTNPGKSSSKSAKDARVYNGTSPKGSKMV